MEIKERKGVVAPFQEAIKKKARKQHIKQSMQENVEQYILLHQEHKRLEEELESRKAELKAYMRERNLTEIESTNGDKVAYSVVPNNVQYDGEQVAEKITKLHYASVITPKVNVSILDKLIDEGKVSKDLKAYRTSSTVEKLNVKYKK